MGPPPNFFCGVGTEESKIVTAPKLADFESNEQKVSSKALKILSHLELTKPQTESAKCVAKKLKIVAG
jgi:hypothetical protein